LAFGSGPAFGDNPAVSDLDSFYDFPSLSTQWEVGGSARPPANDEINFQRRLKMTMTLHL
jgi:hypothetical protein